MSLFEIVLANCIRARSQQDKQPHRVDTDLPTTRAMITRLAAVAALFAISILALDTAGERYERQLATNAVAATRQ
ncbi:hypothetical protein J2W42_001584 [Rhizobium tibeticum]|uniref:Uncharacterized protein n=1 Tax=Rhizobium tibeticum TaxID=501024 RepID=A0A1H8G7F5_9HYPH|nr:hypothetical protein [Rhizobium tibeticum]MDP9808742.1 hypothetical protein [Rhizobium tibeticum]SEH59402.1 hypothetical protein RTCCBAU85039_1301 [Rhizobium tibeticum]SEN39208.1 hypothetical protein SAMN05216228_1004111 [Rhizobium tibeticum]